MFFSEVADVRAAGFEVPRPEQAEHRDQGEVGRVGRPISCKNCRRTASWPAGEPIVLPCSSGTPGPRMISGMPWPKGALSRPASCGTFSL